MDGRVRRSASETVGEAVAQWKSKNLRQTWAQQKMSLTEPGGQLARRSIETRIALDLPTLRHLGGICEMAQPEHPYTVLARQFPPRSDLHWQARQRERTPTVKPPLVVSVLLVSPAPLRSSDAAWLRLSLAPNALSHLKKHSIERIGGGRCRRCDRRQPIVTLFRYWVSMHTLTAPPRCQCPGSRLSRVGSLAPDRRCRIAASPATECGHSVVDHAIMRRRRGLISAIGNSWLVRRGRSCSASHGQDVSTSGVLYCGAVSFNLPAGQLHLGA